MVLSRSPAARDLPFVGEHRIGALHAAIGHQKMLGAVEEVVAVLIASVSFLVYSALVWDRA